MNELLFIFSYTTLWIYNSFKIRNFISNLCKNNSYFPKTIFFIISFGFIITFTIFSSVNILFHFLGITLSNIYYLFFINILLLIINFNEIQIFLKNLFYEIKIFTNYFLKKIYIKNPLILFLILIIAIQGISLFFRFLLPVSHGDQLNQYFFDSLQISRLNNLSINEYYKIGGWFRTDSMASFFDALVMQYTNNWALVRSFRVISLILVILSVIEIFYNLGNFSIKKSLLLICIILTLPDVWDVALSGKHDGYVLLFEMIGIYSIILSVFFKEKILKFIFSINAVFISIASTSIRLSSLSLLLLSIILLFYYFLKYYSLLRMEELKLIFSIKNLIRFLPVFGILFPTLLICLINYKFFLNPFYWLSPPGFLSNIFNDAEYALDYSLVKKNLSLNNIPIIFKSLITYLYATLGLEPIRFGLSKFHLNASLFGGIFNFLNYIGPKDMMVSMLSLTPFSLIPLIKLRNLNEPKKKFLFIFFVAWIVLWTFSIPYTRVAIASSLALTVLGFSIPFKDLNKKNTTLSKSIYYLLFSYGLITICLFSLWSFSNIFDLPVKSLFHKEGFSRTSLTRDYMKRNNNLYFENKEIPTAKFEKDWQFIEEKHPNNILFLKKAPKLAAYFMTKGLILNSEEIILNNKKYNELCFQVDDNYLITDIKC